MNVFLICFFPMVVHLQRMDRFVLQYHIRQFGTKKLARRNLHQLCYSVTRLAGHHPRIEVSMPTHFDTHRSHVKDIRSLKLRVDTPGTVFRTAVHSSGSMPYLLSGLSHYYGKGFGIPSILSATQGV